MVKKLGKAQDLTGLTFGNWTVLRCAGRDKHKNAMWRCKCTCGTERRVASQYLKDGRSTKCRICSVLQRTDKYAESELPPPVWNSVVHGAKQRKISCKITQEILLDLFKQQKGKCALSGLAIKFPNTNREFLSGDWTASLDRIDSKRGYEPGNVQWVYKPINRMKNNLDQPLFVQLCKSVANHHGQDTCNGDSPA